MLGDDADQFTSGQGNIEFLSDGPPELLYEESRQDEDEAVIKFESSFPDIDSRNQVGHDNLSPLLLRISKCYLF